MINTWLLLVAIFICSSILVLYDNVKYNSFLLWIYSRSIIREIYHLLFYLWIKRRRPGREWVAGERDGGVSPYALGSHYPSAALSNCGKLALCTRGERPDRHGRAQGAHSRRPAHLSSLLIRLELDYSLCHLDSLVVSLLFFSYRDNEDTNTTT